MKQFDYQINLKLGLHARPSAYLASKVIDYDSKTTILFKGQEADATKMMSIVSLKTKKDDIVTVQVEGPDEDTAVVAIEKLFHDNF